MNFSSVSGKNWIYNKYDSSDIKNISEKFSLSEITSKLLSIRRKKIGDLDLFLNPKIKNLLPNPMKLKGMNIAVERVYKSINNSDLIGVFGDYDVDGASSTAILARYFLSINQKVIPYIPERKAEGYGPTSSAFKKLISKGVKKIIFQNPIF